MGHIEDAIQLLVAAAQTLDSAAGTASAAMSSAGDAVSGMGAALAQADEATGYVKQVGGGDFNGIVGLNTVHSEAVSSLNVAAGLIDEFIGEARRFSVMCTEKAQALGAGS